MGHYHRNAAQGRAPEQTLASTEVVRHVKRENNHADGLRNAVKASSKKLEVGAGNSESCKDSWGVVGDDIHASHVLTPVYPAVNITGLICRMGRGEGVIHHQAQTDANTVANTLLKQLLELEPSPRVQSGNMCLELDLGANLTDLIHNVRVTGGQLAKIADNLLGFLPTIFLGQPPRRLRAEGHDGEYDDGREQLKTERHLPLGRS